MVSRIRAHAKPTADTRLDGLFFGMKSLERRCFFSSREFGVFGMRRKDVLRGVENSRQFYVVIAVR